MVPAQFFGQNAHFAVNLVAALASFAVFWLVFDAWLVRRRRSEGVKWIGFLTLALAFLINGVALDQHGLAAGSAAGLLATIATFGRIVAYILIVISLVTDPLMARPTYEAELPDEPPPPPAPTPSIKPPNPPAPNLKQSSAWTGFLPAAGAIALPLLAFGVAGLYLRRATTGLERHLRPVALAFGLLGCYELCSAALMWQDTTNPLLYRIVSVYGPAWWVAQILLLAAGIILGRWVWAYLTKRLMTQLFIVFVTATVSIFFVSTVGFSFLLLRNVQTEALSELTTASRVLDYALASRQAETSAQAEAAAQDSLVAAAIIASDHKSLVTHLGDYLTNHQLSSLQIMNASGEVLLRAEDPDRWGDSLSDNSLVGRALIGKISTSVQTQDGVVSPTVSLVAARPIRDASAKIIGVVVASRTISNAFVDGIKHDTSLDSTIFAGSTRAATTLVTSDGSTRALGIKETDSAVKDTVLTRVKPYSGVVSFQHRSYLTAYSPLKDTDNNVVGMLSVARPEDDLLSVASRSIELTFMLAIGLLVVTILPIYWISKKIAGQVR